MYHELNKTFSGLSLHDSESTNHLEAVSISHLNVVIPTTYLGGKKMVFLTPRSQYEVSNYNIWGERTSDDPFQVSNVKFHGGSTCGQQMLTKVAEIGKKRTFQNTHFSRPKFESDYLCEF